jgi:hypothetical protein
MSDISEKFYEFHERNPHLYKSLVLMARRYRTKHGTGAKIGIAVLWENLRWDYLMSTEHHDFKMNNSFRSMYARLIMQAEDDLKDVFETRVLRAA